MPYPRECAEFAEDATRVDVTFLCGLRMKPDKYVDFRRLQKRVYQTQRRRDAIEEVGHVVLPAEGGTGTDKNVDLCESFLSLVEWLTGSNIGPSADSQRVRGTCD